MNKKLITSLFTFCLITLASFQLEAKHRSHFKMHVNTGVAQPAYVVKSTPVIVQQPMVITSPQYFVAPEYYMAPVQTYVVQPQPVIIAQPQPTSHCYWNFANWGISFRL